MVNKTRILFFLLFFCQYLVGQVESRVDTLLSKNDQLVYTLSFKPIVESSAQVIVNGKLFKNVSVLETAGKLELLSPVPDSTIIYVSYNYITFPVPQQIGPLWWDFPHLDSIIVSEGYQQKSSPVIQTDIDPYQSVTSSGTVYRHLQVSPLGGTNFSGGMQISLQGNLSRDIHVSGVLTDQQTGIMPEGNTRDLDEFDQVYLKVDHPNFSITAGDIDYLQSLDRETDIDRKLTGLKQTYEVGNISGSAVFGGSNGSFHEVVLTGQDGNQGPYQLRSKSGNSDIIVLSGTEKVYLDGKRLTRGENHDYTIDYSLGELHFTPRNQIEFDSEIHVEYQYSDFQYSRNLAGGLIRKKIFSDSEISLGWYREYDQIGDETAIFSENLLDSLENAGDNTVTIVTAESDSAGLYILEDGIYLFAPENSSEKRFNVTFQNDPESGEYVRKVTDRGILYYEYIEPDLRTPLTELYSPRRNVVAPVSKDIIYLGGDFVLNRNLNFDLSLKTSNFDQNTLSGISDNDNIGVDYTLRVHGEDIPGILSMVVGYNIEFWSRSKSYAPISRSRDVNFTQDWGFNTDENIKESRFRSELFLYRDNVINLRSGFSQYNFGTDNYKRISNNLSFSNGWIHELIVNQNYVEGNGNVYSQNVANLRLFSGNFHPFIEGEVEHSDKSHNFKVIRSGLTGSWNRISGSVSIGSRIDELYSSFTNTMDRSGESWFGAVDWKVLTKTFRQELELRKRIKDLPLENSKIDYELMRLKVFYNDSRFPVSFDLNSRLEENLTETRAVVFDSVGRGYGQYRYDPVFNEYVEDPNGPYRSYTVFSGDKKPATYFSNTGKVRFDLSKLSMPMLKGFSIDNTFKTEYRGNDFVLGRILQYSISDNLLRAFFRVTTDLVYLDPFSSRRVSLGLDHDQNLNGLDPRGNSQSERTEANFNINEPLNNSISAISKADIHRGERVSLVTVSRDRKYRGWNGEVGLKVTNSSIWRFSGFIQGGGDNGESAGEQFKVSYLGTRFELLRFLGKKGRLEFVGDWNLGSGNVKYYDLPPEVMNNLTLGENIKLQLRGQYLLGQFFSFNSNISFIDNARYDRFVAVSGELRAYF